MSYKALYRSYRPQTFKEVAGQEHVVTTLQNAIKENRISHAYLFAGPRGTGKTTVAKLLAKALNCTGEYPRVRTLHVIFALIVKQFLLVNIQMLLRLMLLVIMELMR